MKNKMGSLSILGLSIFAIQCVHADNNWKVNFKNAYIERDYDSNSVKDFGSWSQSASVFYTSDYYKTPVKDLKLGVDGSAQYAVRLSKDKHVSDTVLPYDNMTKSQAKDYAKVGGTLKLKYHDNELKIGELWPDLPVTPVDGSRQLLSSYLGATLTSNITDKIQLNTGRITKVSPRNSDEFVDFSYTHNSKKFYSNGLSYMDLKYKVNKENDFEYYFGNLENLYTSHYLGFSHNVELNKNTRLNSKIKYFKVYEDNNNYTVDSQNFGILETVNYKNHKFGIGYQQIVGDTYPLPDGFLPETYFINWNTIGFFKANEKSIHLLYTGDYSNYVPGLKLTLKHVYGFGFKDTANRNNK